MGFDFDIVFHDKLKFSHTYEMKFGSVSFKNIFNCPKVRAYFKLGENIISRPYI